MLGLVLLFSFFSASADAINLNTRTTTQTIGKGINGGTNQTQLRNLGPLFVYPFASQTSIQPITSDPFDPTPIVTNGLPTSFQAINTEFGTGAPCGPDDPNGPSFPYPCSSDLEMTLIIPGSINSPGGFLGALFTPPSLGPSGAPFQILTITNIGGGNKAIRVESGLDQTLGNPAFPDVVSRVFFTFDSVIDSNGQLVGTANGTYNIEFNTDFNFPIQSGDSRASGTFTADQNGMLTCLDAASNPCLTDASFQ